MNIIQLFERAAEVLAGPYENMADDVKRQMQPGQDVGKLIERVYRQRTGLDPKPDEIDVIKNIITPPQKSRVSTPIWAQEFGPEYRVPAEVDDLVDQGKLVDVSQQVDASPSFTLPGKGDWDHIEEKLRLFVEHPDAAKRSGSSGYGLTARFTVVMDEHHAIYEGDDVKRALKELFDTYTRVTGLRP